jgi:hypothetical protein
MFLPTGLPVSILVFLARMSLGFSFGVLSFRSISRKMLSHPTRRKWQHLRFHSREFNRNKISHSLLYSSSIRNPDSSSNPVSYRPITLVVRTSEDMEEVGSLLSTLLFQEKPCAARGAVLFLDGDLGAGKTALARGFVRGATGDWDLLVTSPTYLLSNTYVTAITEDDETHLVE